MAVSVISGGMQSLQAYWASLTAGGLAQPDPVISFTGLENKVEGVSALRDIDPVNVAWKMDLQHEPLEPMGDISEFPADMPRPFVWDWSSADARKQAGATPDTRLNKAFRFEATAKFIQMNMIPFQNGDYMIFLAPSLAEARMLGEHLDDLNQHNQRKHAAIDHLDIMAFAKVIPLSDRLIVHNMQTSLFSIRLPAKLRTRYNYWQTHLMLSIEDYAFKAGFREVCLTTANYQMRRWGAIEGGKGLHPSTAYQVYSMEPQKMGYSLVQTPTINIDWIYVNLLWSKLRADFYKVPD